MIQVCKLTPDGFARYEAFLARLSSEPNLQPPANLIAPSRFCLDLLAGTPPPINKKFDSRFDLGRFLVDWIPSEYRRDKGVWAWLTLCLFETVCPLKSNGTRPTGQTARLLPIFDDYRRHYRHLLAGPYLVCLAQKETPESAFGLLCLPPDKAGDLYEQVASRQERLVNTGLLNLLTKLYVDSSTKRLKRGVQGKKGGAARRMEAFLSQLELTHDIKSLTQEDLWAMLPGEFDRFKEEG